MSNNPHERAVEIERISRISSSDFYSRYIKTQKPVVITDQMTSWPAMGKWSLDFFAQLDATVHLEHGNVMQEQTTFKETSFKAYIQRLLAQPKSRSGSDEHGIHDNHVEYLSIFDIFAAFPHLRRDVDFTLMAQYKFHNIVTGWIGPAGAVTGYHIDWADNLFAQLYGRKQFYTISPDQGDCMYPSPKYEYGATISHVDARDYDEKKFPNFARADVLKATLSPGEMLYNPRGWWHMAESLDKSISVNNFGVDLKGVFIDGTRETIKKILHTLGLYGRDCVCHMVVDGKRVAR